MKMLKKLSNLFRKNFIAGLIVIVPILVFFWLAEMVLGALWEIAGSLQIFSHSSGDLGSLLRFLITAGVFILLIIAVSALGFISKFYFGRQLIKLIGKILQRIPILGAVYSSLSQLLETFGQGESNQFRRVVLIDFPRKGSKAIAFVTGNIKDTRLGQDHVNVFIPTVPNPTSGFHLILPESEIVDTTYTVEEAFKMILSLGIAQPEPKK